MRLGCCRCAHTDNGNPARRVCDDVWERNEKLPSGQLICHFLLRMQVSDETRNLQKARRCSLTLRACGGGVRWWRRRGSSVTCTDTSSFWLQCWQDLQEAVQEICEWYLESTERQVWARCVWRASPVWQQIHHNPPQPPAGSLMWQRTSREMVSTRLKKKNTFIHSTSSHEQRGPSVNMLQTFGKAVSESTCNYFWSSYSNFIFFNWRRKLPEECTCDYFSLYVYTSAFCECLMTGLTLNFKARFLLGHWHSLVSFCIVFDRHRA